MDNFDQQIKDYMMREFRWGSKSWQVYEGAKRYCIDTFNPTDEQYPRMIKIITDWLEL